MGRAFQTLRRLNQPIRSPQRLVFCAFDLLHLNGKDLRGQSLLERKAKLKELVPSEHPFLFSEEFMETPLYFSELALITNLKASSPNLLHPNTGVDAARCG